MRQQRFGRDGEILDGSRAKRRPIHRRPPITWRPMPKPTRLQWAQEAPNFCLHELRLNLESGHVDEKGRIRAKLMGARVLEKHGKVALEESLISWYSIIDDIARA